MGLRETMREIDHRVIRLLAFGLVMEVTLVGLYKLAPLVDQGVPAGILAVELSADGRLARELVADVDVARQALWWDFAFISVYTVGLMLALRLLVPLFRLNLLRTNVRSLALAPLAAAVLDAAENVLLLVGTGSAEWADGWFRVAAALAFAKFVIIGGLLLLLVGAVASGLTTPHWLWMRMKAEPKPNDVTVPALQPGLGIALSGGGVRAASLSLGALQELERFPQPMGWSQAARVTAVSGGAYMGGAWQLGREGPDRSPEAWRRESSGKAGPEEQHLLNNLGYLTTTYPRGRPEDPGAPDTLEDGDEGRRRHANLMRSSPAVWATVLTGFLVNAVVLTAVICVLTIPLGVGYEWLTALGGTCQDPETRQPVPLCLVVQPRSWFPPVAWLGGWLVLSLLWTLLGKARRLRRASVLTSLKLAVQAGLAIGVILAVLLLGVPLLVALLQQLSGRAALAAALASAAGVVSAVGRMLRSLVATLAPKLGGIAFVLLLLIGIGSVAKAAWAGALSDSGWIMIWWWVAVAIFVVTWFCFSPELWSMFAFYRGKLRSAYALRRVGNRAQPYVNDRDDDEAAGLRQEPELGTYPSKLTICGSAHATTKAVRTHYGIPAMSFTFEDKKVRMFVPKDDQGGADVYECTLDQLQGAYNGAGLNLTTKRITTMFAVALSGAAVSPAMGRFRDRADQHVAGFHQRPARQLDPQPSLRPTGHHTRKEGQLVSRGPRGLPGQGVPGAARPDRRLRLRQ